MMSTLTIRVLSIVQRLIDWSSLTHSLTHTMIGDVHQSRTVPVRHHVNVLRLTPSYCMYTVHLDIDVRTSTMMYSCIDVVVGGAFIILLLKKE